MTSPDVSVEHFTVFRHPTAEGDMIRVRMHLVATVEDLTKSMTFYGGAVIRGDL